MYESEIKKLYQIILNRNETISNNDINLATLKQKYCIKSGWNAKRSSKNNETSNARRNRYRTVYYKYKNK